MKPFTYSIAHLKAHLSALLRDVGDGQELIITEHNKPVAKLVALRRLPPLPKIDPKTLSKIKPIPLKKGARSSAALIRQMRDEETA